ncbi:efflux RND transporter permease subunit [methane-oxidizing endosymbiont of Gigantopelta aegis]|uniref:efflux RND transporter permease subunit n=1 Tax=methane-oxidizing endosymbiont of Gigantopelta aegis TaxID=2794938 RepID=UPI0018DE364C|nr:efflux RND transporter permease subunit [methane-oxidizing endosymbiont of Gigantopelta aegis]
MNALGRFSLEQKVFFNLLFILLMIAGCFAMFALPTERYPDINMAKVKIVTDYPGASPVDVETLVTRKLEEAIEDIENIEWISSSSQAEHSYITVKFVDDSDYKALYDEIRFNILNAKKDLPDQALQPQIDEVTMGVMVPVIVINLGGNHENRALALMADQIKASLKKINGVKKVLVLGKLEREFHVYLNPERLRFYGISFNEVATALQQINISVTAGKLESGKEEFLIKVDEKFQDRDTLLNAVIRRDGDGSFIRLADLTSQMGFDYRNPSVISTINGKNAIALHVIKTPEGSALAIKKDVLQVLETFKPLIDAEQLDVILTQDSSIRINDGLSTLGWNFVVGMFLVAFISWYFMGFRNAGLISIGIPFSFLFTMLLMHVLHYSFNELTLFTFVLVSGIIVDDAIVVTENIYRYIQKGYQTYEAIVEGVGEVALPVLSSTLTTIAAFLPLFLMSGPTGQFFVQIPAIVCFALVASLFECFFILPVHYLDFGPQKAKMLSHRLEEDNFIVAFLRRLTQRVLNWTLTFRKTTIVSILVLFVLSIGIMFVSITGILPLVKTQFFPADYGVYFIDIRGEPNASLAEMDKQVRAISTAILKEGPDKIESAVGMAGTIMNDDYEFINGNNLGLVIVTLPSKDKRSINDPIQYLEEVREKLKNQFEKEGFVLHVHPLKEQPPAGKPVNIKILGDDSEKVNALADKILAFLQSQPDIAPYLIEMENNKGLPKRLYHFDVQQDRVKEYNLNSQDVARLAGSVLDGRYIGQYRARDEEIDLKLYYDKMRLYTPEQALLVPVVESATRPILLGDLVELRQEQEPGELHRYHGQRAVSIKSDLKTGAPVSANSVVNAVSQYYATIRDQYPGVTILFSGEYESTQKSYQSLLFAFLIAMMMIYIILATQFQSYMQPAIILFAVLFAIIGIVFGKFLAQSLFTINSFIAIIGVIGVVVNDALVLIEFMNKGYRTGLSRREAIEQAIQIRLRPIILTTLTTFLGLLPMALGIPSYSIVWGAMASTFVCGLGVATLLTLWVAPVVWDLIKEREEKA